MPVRRHGLWGEAGPWFLSGPTIQRKLPIASSGRAHGRQLSDFFNTRGRWREQRPCPASMSVMAILRNLTQQCTFWIADDLGTILRESQTELLL